MSEQIWCDMMAALVSLRVLEYRSAGGITWSDIDRVQRYREGDTYDDAMLSPHEHKKLLKTKAGDAARDRNRQQWVDIVAVLSYSIGGIKVFGHAWIETCADNPLDPEGENTIIIQQERLNQISDEKP